MGPNFPGMRGMILVLMLNVCCLAVILIFLVVSACYLAVTGHYLVVTACYCSLLLVPTFSTNGFLTEFVPLINTNADVFVLPVTFDELSI